MLKKTLAVDSEIHGLIKDIANKSGVGINDIIRYMFSKHKDGIPTTDFQRIKIQRELEKVADKKRMISEEERKLSKRLLDLEKPI